MGSQFSEHVRELASLLDGKDPRRIKTKARGTALLMLREANGELARAAIVVDAKRATVTTAVVLPDDADSDFATVQATLEDWLAFYREANDTTLAQLRLHGDVELLSAIGELISAPRQAQDIRAGGAR